MELDENPNGESWAPIRVTDPLAETLLDRLLEEHDRANAHQRDVRSILQELREQEKQIKTEREKRKEVEDSNLVAHAKRELERAGFYDDDVMYGEMLPNAIMELVETFALQGHSGMSASIVTGVLGRLLRFEPLIELTSDPDEWIEVGDGMWQNKRNPAAFSEDGGESWYLLEVSEAKFGERAYDGGVMGTIVRCPECGGSGKLHRPDEEPEDG